MTEFGRLGALFIVLGGAALLIVDGLQSPPGLWYAAAGVIAGTMMVAYTVISTPSSRRPQSLEPASPNASNESTMAPTKGKTDLRPISGAQTAELTESTDREAESAGDDDSGSSDPSTSDEQPEPPSTAVKRTQPFPANTRTRKRTTPIHQFLPDGITARTSTRRKRHVISTASQRRKPSTGIDNRYFTPVESSREIRFIQVDTKFSYIDIDWGPEFIGLDPIPDLIEVDVGPSAVSQELVRSPVEIKISSLLKTLLAPTPRSYGTTDSDDSTRPAKAIDNHTRQQTDVARSGRRPMTRDAWETRNCEQDQRVDCHREPLAAFDKRQRPVETRPLSSDREPVSRAKATDNTVGNGSWENLGESNGGRFDDHRPLWSEGVMEEAPTSLHEMGAIDEPVVDVGMDYSPTRCNPPQGDTEPFGLTDFDPGFSEPDEPMEPIEQPEFGFETSNLEPNVSTKEPAMEPGSGAKILGLDVFSDPPEESIGLPGLGVESGSNPLFPGAESFFPEEDVEDDWLSF